MASGKQVIADSIVDGSITSFSDNDGIETVGDYSFAYSSALTSAYLPYAKTVGKAFKNCSSLVEIVIGTNNGGVVCTYSNSDSSADPPSTSIKIYVPDALVDDYKAATNWSRLADYIYGTSNRT